MVKIINSIKEEWNKLKGPFTAYTAAQTLMNGAIISCQNGGDVYSGGSDAIRNLPFIAGTNLVYAKCVDYITRKCGKYGRLGANLFSLGVSGTFYAYATLTNDNDPTLPSLIAGTIGVILTNKQVSIIQGNLESIILKDE